MTNLSLFRSIYRINEILTLRDSANSFYICVQKEVVKNVSFSFFLNLNLTFQELIINMKLK